MEIMISMVITGFFFTLVLTIVFKASVFLMQKIEKNTAKKTGKVPIEW